MCNALLLQHNHQAKREQQQKQLHLLLKNSWMKGFFNLIQKYFTGRESPVSCGTWQIRKSSSGYLPGNNTNTWSTFSRQHCFPQPHSGSSMLMKRGWQQLERQPHHIGGVIRCKHNSMAESSCGTREPQSGASGTWQFLLKTRKLLTESNQCVH